MALNSKVKPSRARDSVRCPSWPESIKLTCLSLPDLINGNRDRGSVPLGVNGRGRKWLVSKEGKSEDITRPGVLAAPALGWVNGPLQDRRSLTLLPEGLIVRANENLPICRKSGSLRGFALPVLSPHPPPPVAGIQPRLPDKAREVRDVSERRAAQRAKQGTVRESAAGVLGPVLAFHSLGAQVTQLRASPDFRGNVVMSLGCKRHHGWGVEAMGPP